MKLFGVNKITVDDKQSESIFMEKDCGEVLTLKIFEKKALIIIEWGVIKERLTNIKSYEINCEDVQVDVVG